MKLTNFLLIGILILLIADKFQPKKTVNPIQSSKPTIEISKVYQETKTIIPEVQKKNSTIRQSTTLNNYFDTNNRQTIGINHSIRFGQNYYVSGGITKRSSAFYKNDIGFNLSVTKYW